MYTEDSNGDSEVDGSQFEEWLPTFITEQQKVEKWIRVKTDGRWREPMESI